MFCTGPVDVYVCSLFLLGLCSPRPMIRFSLTIVYELTNFVRKIAYLRPLDVSRLAAVGSATGACECIFLSFDVFMGVDWFLCEGCLSVHTKCLRKHQL